MGVLLRLRRPGLSKKERRLSEYTVAHELYKIFTKDQLDMVLNYQRSAEGDPCKENACRLTDYNNGLCMLHVWIEKHKAKA